MHTDQRQTSGHREGADRVPVLHSVLGRLSGHAGELPRCQEGRRQNVAAQLGWWGRVRPRTTYGLFTEGNKQEIQTFPGYFTWLDMLIYDKDNSREFN